MTTMKIRCKLTHPNAKLPTRATPGSVGLDIYACEPAILWPGGSVEIATGLAIELPDPFTTHVPSVDGSGLARVAFQAQVQGRSGLAFRYDIVTHTGTIDADYRGELGVKLWNLGGSEWRVEIGDRVAQLVVSMVVLPIPIEVEYLNESKRSDRGFGSTGR